MLNILFVWSLVFALFFFFYDSGTTEVYTYLHTLSLHDALPISGPAPRRASAGAGAAAEDGGRRLFCFAMQRDQGSRRKIAARLPLRRPGRLPQSPSRRPGRGR